MKYAWASLATLLIFIVSATLVQTQGKVFRASTIKPSMVGVPDPVEPQQGKSTPNQVKADISVPATAETTRLNPSTTAKPEQPTPPIALPPLPQIAPAITKVAAPDVRTTKTVPPTLKRQGDLDKDALSLSLDEERLVGRELNELIRRRHKISETDPLVRRMIEAAKPLYPGLRRKQIDYQFAVIESDDVYAFSHPGGYVYVSRGVFSLIAHDVEEPELQFLLAHEMAHVDLQHDAKLVSAASRLDNSKGSPGVGLLQRLYHQISVGHDESQEIEADAWAFRQLKRIDRTDYQGRRFLRKYLDYVERNGGGGGRKPPKTNLEADVQDIENHWRSHPPAFDRLERLKNVKVLP